MPEWGVVEVLAGLDGGTPISRFFGDGTGDGWGMSEQSPTFSAPVELVILQTEHSTKANNVNVALGKTFSTRVRNEGLDQVICVKYLGMHD